MSLFRANLSRRTPPVELATARVAMLTNFIPPHQRPVYEALAERVGQLTVLLSTQMESDRNWGIDWGDLDVRVQRTLTFRRPRRHPLRFEQRIEVHVPWDTLFQLQRLRPDVIVSNELGVRSLLCSGYRYLSRRTVLIVCGNLSEHTEQGRGGSRMALRRRLVQAADCVTYNGTSGAEYLLGMGASGQRLSHVPYCAAQESLYSGPLSRATHEDARLLYVGHLNELKGILPFTQALSAWAKDHALHRVTFSLVGSGPLAEQLTSLETPDNLSIKLLGPLPMQALPQLYADADMFVFPSLADEWGLVVNEALQAGLPIIGSTFSQAVLDLVTDGATGWKYRPDRDGEMNLAIAKALQTSPDHLNQMRQECRRRVNDLTPEFVADRLVDAIRVAQGQPNTH